MLTNAAETRPLGDTAFTKGRDTGESCPPRYRAPASVWLTRRGEQHGIIHPVGPRELRPRLWTRAGPKMDDKKEFRRGRGR